MKLSIRNIILAAVAVATVALASNSAMAESKVNVPFSFKVAGKSLPAGQYVVTQDQFHNVVTLKSKDASAHLTWVLRAGDPAPTDKAVVLKFDERDRDHSLRSIQYGSQITSRLDKGSDRLEHGSVRIIEGQ